MAIPLSCLTVLTTIETGQQFSEWRQIKLVAIHHTASTHLLDILVGLKSAHINAGEHTHDDNVAAQFRRHQQSLLAARTALSDAHADHHEDTFFDDIEVQIHTLLDSLNQRSTNQASPVPGVDRDQHTDAEQLIIRIHQKMSVLSADATLRSQYLALLELLKLLDLVGAERRLINELITTQRADSGIYQETHAIFMQQNDVLENIRYLAGFPGNEHLFSVLKNTADSAPLNRIHRRVERAGAMSSNVNRLLSHIGYGGLIHAFKNFLVRGDSASYSRFLYHYQAARKLIDVLRVSVVNNRENQDDVKTISDVLDRYNKAIAVIAQAHQRGEAVRDIDKVIRIDDSKALSAVQRLIVYNEVDPERWITLVATRIDQIHAVSKLLSEDIYQRIQLLERNVLQRLQFWLITVVALFCVSIISTLYVARRSSRRMQSLNDALRYVEHSRDFSCRISNAGKDEIGQARLAFNSLLEYLDSNEKTREEQSLQLQELVSDLEQKQRIIDKDEELAKEVFAKIVRAGSSKRPDVDSWNKPMSKFSGDLVLATVSRAGFTYVMMCDFTGHGLPAALGALPVSTAFYPMAEKDISIMDMVIEINGKLRSLLPTSYFCCAALMIMDTNRQSCIFWNGGLPPMLHVSANGELKGTYPSDHLPLGITEFSPMDAFPQEIALAPGDSIYAYTDGLTEALNPSQEMFSEDRLLAALRSEAITGSRIQLIRDNVEDFMAAEPASDDISIIELTA